jgi:hypothetical protein
MTIGPSDAAIEAISPASVTNVDKPSSICSAVSARKPWLKLEISRRTWYRRQAEKRKGRE